MAMHSLDELAAFSPNIPDTELTTNFGNSDYDIAAPNWGNLGNIFDLWPSAPSTPKEGQVGFPHNETNPNDQPDPNFFARYASSSPYLTPSSRHSTTGSSPGMSSSMASSYDGQVSTAISIHSSAHHTSTPQGDRPFHYRLGRSFPPENAPSASSNDPPLPKRHEGPARTFSSTSKTAFFRSSELPLHSPSSNSRCTLQCHVSLTHQPTYITECQADSSSLALDVLLSLDDQIRHEHDKILRCPVCLGKHRRGLTLLLITMVVEKLLSLFERERAVDLASSIENLSRRSTSSTRNSSPASSSSLFPFPHTTRPLTIGDFQLDDAVKLAFSRQMGTVAQLEPILAAAEGRDVSCKVTWELLADMAIRMEYFLGTLALTDGTESFSARREVFCIR